MKVNVRSRPAASWLLGLPKSICRVHKFETRVCIQIKTPSLEFLWHDWHTKEKHTRYARNYHQTKHVFTTNALNGSRRASQQARTATNNQPTTHHQQSRTRPQTQKTTNHPKRTLNDHNQQANKQTAKQPTTSHRHHHNNSSNNNSSSNRSKRSKSQTNIARLQKTTTNLHESKP